MYPSLAKLRSFVAVAEQGRFRQASEMLGISQPALSLHIRDLEENLGVTLLNRTTRSVKLTSEGEKLLNRARKVFAELDSALLELRDEADLRRGRVVVAVVPSLASQLLPAVIVEFTCRYPGIKVHLIEDDAGAVERRVDVGEADFGLGSAPEHHADLEFVPLARDKFLAMVPLHHPLAKQKSIKLSRLAEYPFLTVMQGTNIRRVIERAVAAEGCTLSPAYELLQHHTIAAMVAAGLGVTALPSMSIALIDRSRVRVLPISGSEVSREVGIFRRRGEAAAPAVRAFMLEVARAFGLERDFKPPLVRLDRRQHLASLLGLAE